MEKSFVTTRAEISYATGQAETKSVTVLVEIRLVIGRVQKSFGTMLVKIRPVFGVETILKSGQVNASSVTALASTICVTELVETISLPPAILKVYCLLPTLMSNYLASSL